MDKIKNIGIIGQGFVGNALFQKFKNFFDVYTFDLDKSRCNSRYSKVIKCSYIFICLPTPMNKDGSCNSDIVENELKRIKNVKQLRGVIIKSTVEPGTTEKWNKKFDFNIVFNPEFLTERNAVKDYENQKRIILGGPRPTTTELKSIFSKVFPKAYIVKTGSTHAEMVKYLTNCFLATKVSFANEIYDLCAKMDLDYDKVVEYSVLDERLGKSHWSVPGPDGDFGFGGHCFPKDLSALISLTKKKKSNNILLKSVAETNEIVRQKRDWEDMKGRAVI